MKKHVFINIIGAILGILIGYYIAISESEYQTNLFLNSLLSAFCGVLIAYIVYCISIKLDQVLPWQTQLGNRLLIGIIIHYITVVIITSGLIYLFHQYFSHIDSLEHILIKLAIILLIVTLIYSVIYFALYSYYSYINLQISAVKADRKQVDLQLKALKSQLSPHFLFNNLNTISSLIYKDTKKAEIYIRNLSKLYLNTLKTYHTKLVSLDEELDLVLNYKYLLQTRFEYRFKCTIEIPPAIRNSQIPPLTLQMLVENAIKHNQMDEKIPLHIDIIYDGQYICVKNNITEIPKKVNSFNIGLKNINSRYLLLCKRGIIIHKNKFFTVQIPVIK